MTTTRSSSNGRWKGFLWLMVPGLAIGLAFTVFGLNWSDNALADKTQQQLQEFGYPDTFQLENNFGGNSMRAKGSINGCAVTLTYSYEHGMRVTQIGSTAGDQVEAALHAAALSPNELRADVLDNFIREHGCPA